MFKNFSPRGLGVSGRQSELIELALTYGFRGMEVDMVDVMRRAQRTDFEQAAKYLNAADIKFGGFVIPVELDADDDSFTNQVGQLHPMSEMAARLGGELGVIDVPAGTDRLPYHEYFDQIRERLRQIAEVLAAQNIKLGINFLAGADRAEGKEFEFVRNVEGFLALVKAVPGDNVGMVLDTWNWQVGGGGKDQLQEIGPERVVGLRLADLPDTVSAGEAKSADRVLPTVGGVIDHVGSVKWLLDSGYEGPVSPYLHRRQAAGRTRESIVKEAQEAIDAILTEAGMAVPPLPMDLIDQSGELITASVGEDGSPASSEQSGSDSEKDSESQD